MSSRVSPTQRLRAEIDEVFAGNDDLAGAVEQIARLAASCSCRPRWKPR